MCLDYLSTIGDEASQALGLSHFKAATTMTDSLAALKALHGATAHTPRAGPSALPVHGAPLTSRHCTVLQALDPHPGAPRTEVPTSATNPPADCTLAAC